MVFHQLRKESLGGIVQIQLGRLRQRLRERQMEITLTPAAAQQVAAEGWDPTYGARPLKRTIQQRIENPLAGRILAGEFGAGDHVTVDWDGGRFVFTK